MSGWAARLPETLAQPISDGRRAKGEERKAKSERRRAKGEERKRISEAFRLSHFASRLSPFALLDALPFRSERGGIIRIDPAVTRFIKAIPPVQRPLFDRLHRLILDQYPDAAVSISYQIPCYRTAGGKVFLGLWKSGVSLHAIKFEVIAEFKARYPEIKTGKGSLNFKTTDMFTDGAVRKVLRQVLGG
jgi:uncharacterized protein YdhG (YjbR/CyaY superfamily)